MTTEIGNSALLRTWANDGTVTVPNNAKIDEGWLRGEQPPHEWMNYIHNILGQKINHALSRGAADWVDSTEYLAGAIVNRNGSIWLATATNTDSAPSDSNSNWLKLLAVGDNPGLLRGAGFMPVQTLYFTANGSFVKADYPWLRAVRVKCQGGGAGGTGSNVTNGCRGGGSGGTYAESFITDIAGLDASVTVTVGAGGTGGTATASTVLGGAGGASSFGSLVSAAGGGPGSGASGGMGTAVGTGQLIIPGSGGGGGSLNVAEPRIAGHGGDSVLGANGGGLGDGGALAGRNGLGYGSGGGGCRSGAAGGDGAPGIVIVELFA
jgi:hypothetical protein